QVVGVGETPARGRAPRLHAEHEILLDGEGREDGAIFRHVAEAAPGDLIGPETGQALALEDDRARGRHVGHDRLERGRAADAVAPEDADDLAGSDVEIDALQDMALAVI